MYLFIIPNFEKSIDFAEEFLNKDFPLNAWMR